MPAMSCAELLTKVAGDARKINFLILGQGARWKCFIKAEAMQKSSSLSPEESSFDIVTGLVHGEGRKVHFLVDGDRARAREALKAAWRAEKLKWDDAQIRLVGEDEVVAPPAPATVAPTPARPGRAAPDAPVEYRSLGPQRDAARQAFPFAASRIAEMSEEIEALFADKPGLAAQRVRELEHYLSRGVKAEAARRQMRSFATDLARARNRAGPEDQARIDKLKTGFDGALETDPAKALQIMDALRKLTDPLVALSGKELGDVLRELIPRVQAAKKLAPARAAELETSRQALMESMKIFDQPGVAATATRQLRELQRLCAEIEAASNPAQVQRTLGRRLFLAKDDSGRTKLPGVAIADPDFIAAVASEIGHTEDGTKSLYQAYIKKLGTDTDALLPKGFNKPMKGANTLNPLVPDETRPRLNATQAKALQDYSSPTTTDNANAINKPLRENRKPAPPHDKTMEQLRAAFKLTRPMAAPVDVTRDYEFKTPALVESFLAQFREGLASGQPVRIKTFLSTGAGGRPKTFKGNVVLFIKACRGLDMSPYTEVPQEKELLLDYMTPLKVLSMSTQGEEHHVHVEQLPD